MARDAGLLTRVLTFRNLALAFWVACALAIVVPAFAGSSRGANDAPFQKPVFPPGPHPAIPLKD